MLTVGSLCAGIGGIDLGLERTGGFKTSWFAEVDPFCTAVLRKHWPDVPNHGDITKIGSEVGYVDVLAGGFPCQPVSLAGKGLAQEDPRWLWPHVARLVGDLRPRYVLLENVIGLRTRGLGDVIAGLADLGYDAEWQPFSASSVGAQHKRRRFFIVAYPRRKGLQGIYEARREEHLQSIAADVRGRWEAEPAVARVADGVPRRVVLDHIRALGNAVVPQVAEVVGRLILADAAR